MDKPIWAATDGDGTYLLIYQDKDPINPRKWDNLGTMVCWHRRHTLGDPHKYENNQQFMDATFKIPKVIKPLYIYDHSGIVLGFNQSVYPFNDPWDAGQVGWVYATHQDIRKDQGCKYITKRIKDEVDRLFRAELEEYNRYLSGDVYGYRLVKSYNCPTCGQDVEEELDSCWGFSGREWKENGLVDQLAPEYRELVDKLENVV